MPVGRARLLLWSALALVLLGDVAVLATGGGERGSAEPLPSASTTTTTIAPPPLQPVVVFGRATDPKAAVAVAVSHADGTGFAASAHPDVRTDQVAGRRKVWSKILADSSTPFSGCGFAGCSSGYNRSTQAGIALARTDGTHERLLTEGGYDTEPAFGPDGETIAYIRHQRVKDSPYDTTNAIAFMNIHGLLLDVLVPPVGHSYDSFAWSPDGTQVAVLRHSTNTPADVAGASSVRIFTLADRAERELVAGNFTHLAWSHDGTRLAGVRMAYVQYRDHSGYQPGDHHRGEDLWLLPLDGTAPQQLTRLAPPDEASTTFCGGSGATITFMRQPMWSPDDRQIAFLSNQGHLKTFGRLFDVWVAAVDGSGVHNTYAAPQPTCERQYPETVTLYGWARGNVAA